MHHIDIDYPTSSRNEPRYPYGKPNKYIDQALQANVNGYRTLLNTFPKYFEKLKAIEPSGDAKSEEPYYINFFFSGLDCVALYCLLAELGSTTYVEVGSGHSTKFARRSIVDNRLNTKIISIDPRASAAGTKLCDEIISKPLEDIDLDIFNSLQQNDIIFIDGSHRAFMNSDVTTYFLDIMPCLARGVYLHIHDIFWPLDYPSNWNDRYYNEQYLLGALLANGLQDYEVVLPNFFVSLHGDLLQIVEPLWASKPQFDSVDRHGCSFWMRRK